MTDTVYPPQYALLEFTGVVDANGQPQFKPVGSSLSLEAIRAEVARQKYAVKGVGSFRYVIQMMLILESSGLPTQAPKSPLASPLANG